MGEFHGRGRQPVTLSTFRDRLSRTQRADGTPFAFQGWQLTDGRLEDNTVVQTVVLGPMVEKFKPGVQSRSIPVTADPKRQPEIGQYGDLIRGQVVTTEDGFVEIVGGTDGDRHSRLFQTGLIIPKFIDDKKKLKGARQREFQKLRVAGIKLGYHGIFALELGSGHVVAEGKSVDVLASTDILELTDPATAKLLKGLDVPESRDIIATVPKGGAIICGDLGFLTIHERDAQTGRWKIWDVTNDPTKWQLFHDYAEADLKAKAEAKKTDTAPVAEVAST